LRYYRWLTERALEQVDDHAFFASLDDESNPIAVVIKHLAGNMLSRFSDFGRSDGEKPDRDRDAEFELYVDDTRVRLEMKLNQGWDLVESTVDGLTPDALTNTVFVRGQPLSVLEAVNRQLTHYAYHVGQIVYVARAACGPRWESLSIPRGHSASFNAKLGRGHAG
jgi:hypothetical protein